MRIPRFVLVKLLVMVVLGLLCSAGSLASAAKAKPNIFKATLEQPRQRTPELTTDEFKAFLTGANAVVLDARPKLEFDVAHIAGSLSVDKTGLLRIVQTLPSASTAIVVYSNGPYCDWAKRRAEELLSMGYTNVSRYQLGLAVWRALGNTAETSLDGFRLILQGNATVLIDARNRGDYAAGTIAAAESVLVGEVSKAVLDHRLQYYDHASRIVVFGNSMPQARAVAEEIALNGYPNSSFFNGTYQDLKQAKFFTERKPSPFNLVGLPR